MDGTDIDAKVSDLRLASAGDPVVLTALNSLPARVYGSGIKSMHLLTKRFEEAKKDCEERALIPESKGVVQHALAVVSSNLTFGSKVNDTAQILSQARDELEKGDLLKAVSLVESLPATVKEGAADWLSLAKDRLDLEAALRLVNARVEQTD